MSRPRWVEHKRTYPPNTTLLRTDPFDSASFCDSEVVVYNDEVVEVVDRQNGYVCVKLQLSQQVGWVRQEYIRGCPEGTRDHGKRTGVHIEILPNEPRFDQVQKMITKTKCTNPGCRCRNFDIRIKKLWRISGHYLGETGMVTGPKETMFRGVKDAKVNSTVANGFGDHMNKNGSLGEGIYFSPQSCKAVQYAENFLFVCEVALGRQENRKTVTAADSSLSFDEVFTKNGYRSVQCHAGAPFMHEERVVYKATQCKPVYLVEMTAKSPGGGV